MIKNCREDTGPSCKGVHTGGGQSPDLPSPAPDLRPLLPADQPQPRQGGPPEDEGQ